jgi:hypothetical protein
MGTKYTGTIGPMKTVVTMPKMSKDGRIIRGIWCLNGPNTRLFYEGFVDRNWFSLTLLAAVGTCPVTPAAYE